MPGHPRRRSRTERDSLPSCLQTFALPADARHTTPAARDPKGVPPRWGLTHGPGACSIWIPRIFTTPTRSGPMEARCGTFSHAVWTHAHEDTDPTHGHAPLRRELGCE